MTLSSSTAKPISNISRYNYAKLHGKHTLYIGCVKTKYKNAKE